jgi:N-acetylmuramoyl-L-alanine amidase
MPQSANPGREFPLRRPGTALALLLALSGPAFTGSTKRELALQYYEQATDERGELERRPEDQRDPGAYQKVINSFRRVYLTSPQSSKADDSLLAVAELYAAMSERFGPAPYRQKAIDACRFLINEYPYSPLREQARKKLEELEAAAGGAEIQSSPVHPMVAAVAPVFSRPLGLARVTNVRHWSLPGLTRVVVELEAEVKVHSERLSNPERVYFDLPGTRLSAELKDKTLPVRDDLVKQVRMAHTQIGVTRVVLDLNANADYTISSLTNPPRVVVELRKSPPATMLLAKGSGAKPHGPAKASESMRAATGADSARVESKPAGAERVVSPRDFGVLPDRGDAGRPAALGDKPAGRPAGMRPPSKGPAADPSEPSPEQANPGGKPLIAAVIPREKGAAKPADHVAAIKPAAGEEAAQLAPKPPSPPPRAAQPNSRGERDLIRVLGLKVARVVIDAGHGGHDTGTIGPTGLMEKDLALDVATRLGALVSERIGSEVIFTRTDDRFVPLEERTALANEKKADLFISIHANSSPVRSVRGIETYYLNLTADSEALDVAARENAASQKSIHDLTDLVSKIALTEKISESREFAVQVQRALYTAVAREGGVLRNRGVRKAPFVVLIGARMPSVLAEVSFLSNPRDEKLLKTPAYRQKIAEALYNGLASYSKTLSQVEVAVK